MNPPIWKNVSIKEDTINVYTTTAYLNWNGPGKTKTNGYPNYYSSTWRHTYNKNFQQ